MDYPKVKVCLDTSEDNLIDELYTPCLKWAERFDRGVGYFTTGWLTYNVAGLSDFASRGGKMRLITSPILSTEDTDAIIGAENQDGSAFLRLEAALLENVEILKQEMEADIINTFSWMLYDGIIDMRFAIPCEKLEEGDFHDKFGIFYKGNDALSFSGSINDSKHGFQNYESIKVFKTWAGTQEYVDADTARFEKIWNRKDRNLKMFTIPQAVKNKIFELRSPDRPYSLPAGSSKWVHQDIAVKTFLEKEHGILAMATGTGKTVTAMKIINKLFDSGEIRRVVITMYGNDLLDQWAIQIRENYKNKQINYHYASQKMMKDFVMHPDDSILILSRDARNLSKLLDLFDRLPGDYRNDTLFVFDEVHGAGSNTFVENLSGRLSPYRYRLGLSATPEREYDEAGNDFLLNEIGEVIFEFTLQDAIQKGILCEFNYIPLPYVLSDEEKLKKRKIIAAFNAKKESGEPVDEKDMITRNGDGPYDLDYNLLIMKAEERYWNDLRLLKETVRNALNRAERREFFSDAQDSTSCLTALLHFKDTPNVEFSFDVAITTKNKNGNYMRLIHNKNVYALGLDQYTWNEVPNSHQVKDRADKLKRAGLWQKVRDRYLEKKNMYLFRQDHNHPSFVVYVEAVNEVYNRYFNRGGGYSVQSIF